MKSDTPDRSGPIRHLMIKLAMILLCMPAMAQQTVTPGSVALESEQEEIRRYSVELIVFEYTDRSSAGTEIFDPDEPPVLPEEDLYFGDTPLDPAAAFDDVSQEEAESEVLAGGADTFPGDDTTDLAPAFIDEPLVLIPTYEQAGLQLLGPGDYVLDDVYERLERLDAYRPLMRAAWIQPTLEKEVTTPIKIRRLGNPPLRLDGTVTLYLSRFLHLVIDLSLEEKSPLRGPAANERVRRYGDQPSRFSFDPQFVTPSTFYRIEEDRIVRNGELRYYDHPRFGVLAKITRVEEDSPEENGTGTLATPITGGNR